VLILKAAVAAVVLPIEPALPVVKTIPVTELTVPAPMMFPADAITTLLVGATPVATPTAPFMFMSPVPPPVLSSKTLVAVLIAPETTIPVFDANENTPFDFAAVNVMIELPNPRLKIRVSPVELLAKLIALTLRGTPTLPIVPVVSVFSVTVFAAIESEPGFKSDMPPEPALIVTTPVEGVVIAPLRITLEVAPVDFRVTVPAEMAPSVVMLPAVFNVNAPVAVDDA
jgi:hypothetical protein